MSETEEGEISEDVLELSASLCKYHLYGAVFIHYKLDIYFWTCKCDQNYQQLNIFLLCIAFKGKPNSILKADNNIRQPDIYQSYPTGK